MQHSQENQTLLDRRRVVHRHFGLGQIRVWELRVFLASILVFIGVYVAVELNKKHSDPVETGLTLFKPLFEAQAPPRTLFPYTDEQKTFLPPKFMAPGIVGFRPIPTNNWWGNMIAATQMAGVQPIWANPYSLQPSLTSSSYGLSVSYPYPTRVFGGGRSGNGDAKKFYRHGHVPDFTFSAVEFSTPPTFEVFDWDDLGVRAAQKYASLCLMAADTFVTGHDSTELLERCLTKLKKVLAPFLTNSWTYSLKYDTVYCGILSSQGFVFRDVNADFGNTMYNDHHYHYGYWIVTAAIVNKLDPTWSGLAQLNRMTRFLVRDVANPSSNDPYFTKFRNFDWFRGHSYSHGVLSFADGKDQESSSEDMNFHYGIALFGQVTGDKTLETIGQLMVKLNARAIQTYFLLTDANRAQPSQFRANKVTGILFDNKVNYATWFSPEKYAIHGIQMIPISPITEYVRTRQFITEEWDQVLARIPSVVNDLRNPWLSLLYANYATPIMGAVYGSNETNDVRELQCN
ncbi:hypothetical protein BBP00_00002970 [Phytophthora kernoviae]|uniref:glucan endo-1,3-beta-D-glucosidase n=1 Tax=Phytophthora kernoviae TaxID=325452 RepID=A0A3F2RVW8_9STRA|nr:hypothetical protein BBP00_00002970 [Phytophthora kernoviae]